MSEKATKMWGHRISVDLIDKFNKFVDKMGFRKDVAMGIMIKHFIKTYKHRR